MDAPGAPARIRLLPPEEARKIAAGEVIDRPAAIVRELLDNAIDSGAAGIEVSIEEGGVRLVEVSDNGSGMEEADLLLAARTHATSKIRCLDDLSSARTLGFRGEALASIAAAAELEILTSPDGERAWRFTAAGADGPDGDGRLEAARRVKGTSVRARRLFTALPARKRFLKRPAAEAAACFAIFLDKALAFPRLSFRFTQDGRLRLFLPAVPTYRERFACALLAGSRAEAAFLHEIATRGQGFSAAIVIGGPELPRPSRDRQYVFVNGRRINDFALQQTLEYGSQGAFPNGTHPAGALYIDIDPALADFNIHPAKREARLSCAADIHHALTQTLLSFFSRLAGRELGAPDTARHEGGHARAGGEADSLYGASPDAAPPGSSPQSAYSTEAALGSSATPSRSSLREDYSAGGLRYVGKAFGLFILIEDERAGALYAIDQHAAHERLLYERCLSRPIPRQELLVPIPFTTDSLVCDRFLQERQSDLARLGVLVSGGEGAWQIDALPELWRLGDRKTVEALLSLMDAGEDITRRWAATLACHAAIKEGDHLAPESALTLARQALALPDKRCPHGRPILTTLTKTGLLEAVKRT